MVWCHCLSILIFGTEVSHLRASLKLLFRRRNVRCAAGAGRTALAGGEYHNLRLRETSGRPVHRGAGVRSFPGVAAAWLTDLMEESDGAIRCRWRTTRVFAI